MKRMSLTIALALLPLASSAEFYSGNDLARLLATDAALTARGNRGTTTEGHESGIAMGFVVGVHDVYRDVTVCSPPGVTVGQVLEIVRMYFRAIPHRLHETAEKLVSEALAKAFPCEQRKPPASRSL
jgi:hypothetical protein